jgi:hypothetical protein
MHQPLAQLRKPPQQGSRSAAADKVMQKLYDELSKWLGGQHCQSAGSQYDELKLIDERLKVYLQCRPSPLPPVTRCGYTRPIGSDVMPVTSYLMLGMTDLNGPGCSSDRLKLARLSNQCLAMVPKTAQVGNIICQFNLAGTKYVLRKTTPRDEDLDATILDFLLDSQRKVEDDLFGRKGIL